MTIRQEAYRLIDRLPEDSVHAVVEIMIRMIPAMKSQPAIKETEKISPKMKAFMRMQELRKEMAKYNISEAERAAALDEKYGEFSWGGKD